MDVINKCKSGWILWIISQLQLKKNILLTSWSHHQCLSTFQVLRCFSPWKLDLKNVLILCWFSSLQYFIFISLSLSEEHQLSHNVRAELTKGINYWVMGMLQICEMIQREISKVITLNDFQALIWGPLKQALQSCRWYLKVCSKHRRLKDEGKVCWAVQHDGILVVDQRMEWTSNCVSCQIAVKKCLKTFCINKTIPSILVAKTAVSKCLCRHINCNFAKSVEELFQISGQSIQSLMKSILNKVVIKTNVCHA